MSFTKFPELAPELRLKIWDAALRQEIEDRLIIVHCHTMRVIPHTSTRSQVMRVNQESRHHARTFYYDVKLKVWTADVSVMNIPTEIVEFGKTSLGWSYHGDTHPRSINKGLLGGHKRLPIAADMWLHQLRRELQISVNRMLDTPFRRPGQGRPRRQGWVFVSSQHDRFALAGPTHTDNPSWDDHAIDLCEKAFLRDYICGPTREVMQESTSPPSTSAPQDYGVADYFQARHMADPLTQPVQMRIRHVVYLRDQYRLATSGAIRHVCGPSTPTLNAGNWDLDAFKGARFLYTGYMDTIPSSKNLLGPNKLVEWKKSEMDTGRLVFTCLCKSGGEKHHVDDNTEEENDVKTHMEHRY